MSETTEIWRDGKKYDVRTMPANLLAKCLREDIEVDYEDKWLPETYRDECYALLEEAARRISAASPKNEEPPAAESPQGRPRPAVYDDCPDAWEVRTVTDRGRKVRIHVPTIQPPPFTARATEAQLLYANKIADALGIAVPSLNSKLAFQGFISRHVKEYKKALDKGGTSEDDGID